MSEMAESAGRLRDHSGGRFRLAMNSNGGFVLFTVKWARWRQRPQPAGHSECFVARLVQLTGRLELVGRPAKPADQVRAGGRRHRPRFAARSSQWRQSFWNTQRRRNDVTSTPIELQKWNNNNDNHWKAAREAYRIYLSNDFLH